MHYLKINAVCLTLFASLTGANIKMNPKTVAVAALSLLGTTTQAQKSKPNVIILFSDQHAAGVVGYEGHADAITPNLDRMSRQGVAFGRAYCQDAISVASRNSLFTGLYPRTIGCLDNSRPETSVMSAVVSMQEAFRRNGYATYAFGKRHLEGKADEGWTLHRSHIASESPRDNYVSWIAAQGYAEAFGKDWAAEFGRFPKGNTLVDTPYPTAPMGTRISELPENYTMEAYSALNTIDMIRQHGQEKTPFFCFTSFYRPHQPYTPLPKYMSFYDRSRWGRGTVNGDGIVMPETLRQPADQLPPMLAALRTSEKGIWCLGKAAQDEQLYREYIGAYYALVQEIDHWAGEIFRALEENGLANNTIVVYTSDHGDFVGSHGMIEKAALGHNVYEETLRVPLIFWWPGHLKTGYRSGDLVELLDIYPTLAELTGIALPDLKHPLQGLSLRRNLTAGKPVKRTYTVSENWSQATVITRNEKLGIWLDPKPVARDYRAFGPMLFERTTDPGEVNNLAADSTRATTVKRLTSFYEDFCKRINSRGKEEMKTILSTKKNRNIQ